MSVHIEVRKSSHDRIKFVVFVTDVDELLSDIHEHRLTLLWFSKLVHTMVSWRGWIFRSRSPRATLLSSGAEAAARREKVPPPVRGARGRRLRRALPCRAPRRGRRGGARQTTCAGAAARPND